MRIIEKLKNRARAFPQHIVLPEGEDVRVIQAAARVTAEGYAKLTLLGRKNLDRSRSQANRRRSFGHQAGRSRRQPANRFLRANLF